MDGWDNFFLGQVGASAALLGFLFVAVSINLERILSSATLPDRALVAMGLLLAVLLLSSLTLVPGQPPAAFGIEALVVALALIALGLRTHRRAAQQGGADSTIKSRVNMLLFAIAVLPYLAGSIAFIYGEVTTGLYLLAAGMVVSIVKAVLDAWVLLVEIER